MPSSRGGGFSGGGGGHHGGFSSGGGHHHGGYGGNNNNRRYSSRPFPGGRRYSYINRRGRTCFFFYGGVPRRRSPVSTIIVLSVVILMGAILGGIMLYAMIPTRLSAKQCTPIDSYYEDNAEVFSESEAMELEKTLKAFYQKTGAQPYLFTFYYDEMPEKYNGVNQSTMEDYAYDKYTNMFLDDEGHWLILLAVNRDENASKTDKWIWIEMSGYDAQEVVTDSLFYSFRNDMQTFLNVDSLTMGEGLNRAYSNALDDALKLQGEELTTVIMLSLFMVIFIGGLLAGMIRSVIEIRRVNEYCDYRDRTGGAEGSYSSDGSDLFD